MKAVVMAGGSGSRMRPYLARGINKHVTPLGDRPLLHHLLEILKQSGVDEVLILSNGINPGQLMECTGDGSLWNMGIYHSFNWDDVARGPAWNLLSARRWIADEPVLTVLGDSMYFDPLPDLHTFFAHPTQAGMWCMPLSPQWDEVGKYAQISESHGRVTSISRTGTLTTGLVQTGAWVFPPDVFDIVERIARKYEDTTHEVRLTDVSEHYVTQGLMYCVHIPACSFIDCGTPAALRQAENELSKRRS